MAEERKSDVKSDKGVNVQGGSGITAGGNVIFGDVSGQVGIGENISQTKLLSSTDKTALIDALKKFKDEIVSLGLPDDELDIVKGDVTSAIKEAQKEKPDLSTVKKRFQNVIDTVKQVGSVMNRVAESPVTKTIIGILSKLGLAIAI